MTFLYKTDYLKEEIIYLNTEGQLYEGIDSTGESFAPDGYAPYTIAIKERKGQPVDRITLKDTGAFYKSFRIELTPDFELQITANPIKEDTNLIESYGADIIGLTEENIAKIRTIVRQLAINYTLQKI